MKNLWTLAAAGLSLGLLVACDATAPVEEPTPETDLAEPATAPDTETETPEAEMDEEPETEATCAVLESTSWEAWINAMPGPDATQTLHVAGEVVMPTPGYTLALTEGRTDRSAVPVLQLILAVTPPAEDEMVMQVLTPETVTFEGPALPNGYSKITIMCEGAPLAEITEIIIAQ